MRRFLLVSLVALAVAPAAAAAPGFSYGVAAGEVTASSAVLWTRSNELGPVRLFVWPSPRKGMPVAQITLRPTNARDRVVQRRVHGLKPNTRYTYMFSTPNRKTAIAAGGSFWTAPAPGAAATVRFAISGDADGARDPKTGKPAYNVFQVYGRMAAERNHFNINLGDTIYSDSEVGGVPPALSVAAKWGKYKQNLGFGHLRNLRRDTGLYSHWDDHEFINDFSVAEHGRATYRAGVTAFRDYAPVTYSSANGLYRTFKWGKHLELFFLDERSFRSAKVTAACGGDLAPTAPQPVRNAFAALVPSLANPVPPACQAAVNDPSRTMLGARQYAAFTKAIKASTATWKVVVNEVPIQQFYALPYDRWEGYAFERERLLRFLQANTKNVVFLTTDTHANFVNEVRLRTLEPGGPVGTGIWEVVTGPVATNTQNKEVDETLGRAGLGSAIVALFYKPAPPNGVGMACASGDVYSYASVRVTGATLTVTPKDSNGRLVREETGIPCGPFVFRAR
ncbi:MAG: alkaline phosphatase D family protein [Actinomycetota bacterium]|nr:alkaline phosphatase D family protein [Actinomycetota bacterium]